MKTNTKYRIKELVYENAASEFQVEYYMGDEVLKTTKEMGYNTDGWCKIGEVKQSMDEAKTVIENDGKFFGCTVVPLKLLKETIVHEIK